MTRKGAQHAPALGVSTPGAPFPTVEQVLLLADHAEIKRTAFQSVAIAALQALDRACYHERRTAEATISLAQGQKLQHMIVELEAMRQALDQMLGPHGVTMRSRNTSTSADEAPESSWWFALCETLHTLGEGASGIQSIAAGQPRSSATRTLTSIVARLLEQHYHALFGEAEQWLG